MTIIILFSQQVVLENDTIQMQRFEDIPFFLTFKARLFNISNPEDVLIGGIPVVRELGPYVYR